MPPGSPHLSCCLESFDGRRDRSSLSSDAIAVKSLSYSGYNHNLPRISFASGFTSLVSGGRGVARKPIKNAGEIGFKTALPSA